MIHRYTCPVCGYDRAVWKLTLSNSTLTYCENCYSLYIRKTAHTSAGLATSTPSHRSATKPQIKTSAMSNVSIVARKGLLAWGSLES